MASSLPTVTLKGGKSLPILAFGVGTALYQQDCSQQVSQALQAGFRFLDTAEMYANSQHVGPATKSYNDVIILDKIGDTKNIRKAALEEKEKLQVNKFDALLLHSPPRGKDGHPSNVDAWKEMEKLKDEGIAE